MEYLIVFARIFSLVMIGTAVWHAYKKDYSQAGYEMTIALMLWLMSK